MALFTKRGGRAARDMLWLNAFCPQIIEESDRLLVDDYGVKVLVWNEFLTENDLGWGDVFLEDPDMPMCIRLFPADASKVRSGVDRNDYAVQEGLMNFRNTASRNEELYRQQAHGMEMLRLLGDEGERFFEASIYSVRRVQHAEDMERDLRHFDARKGALGYTSLAGGALTSYLAASPLMGSVGDEFSCTVRHFPASTLAWLLPYKVSGLDDVQGVRIGHEPMGGLVRLNMLRTTASRPNRNAVYFGTSGSGKTTASQVVYMQEYLVQGAKVIWIDPEGEQVRMGRNIGAEIVNVGGSSFMKISPFEPRAVRFDPDGDGDLAADVSDEGDQLQECVMASTVPFVKTMLQMAFRLNDEDMPYLELALYDAYGEHGVDMDTTFREYYREGMSYPVMADLDAALCARERSDPRHTDAYDRLANQLYPASKGIYAKAWNSRSSMGIDSDFTIINTQSMSDDEAMKQAQYYNILTWVWTQIRANRAGGGDRPIRVVIDEAHTIVNKRTPQAAEFVRQFVKRIRKYGGGTTCITQEVADFVGRTKDTAYDAEGAGVAICNNATYKFFGQSDGNNADACADVFGFSEEVRAIVESQDAYNFAVFAGKRDRARVQVDVEPWMGSLLR